MFYPFITVCSYYSWKKKKKKREGMNYSGCCCAAFDISKKSGAPRGGKGKGGRGVSLGGAAPPRWWVWYETYNTYVCMYVCMYVGVEGQRQATYVCTYIKAKRWWVGGWVVD